MLDELLLFCICWGFFEAGPLFTPGFNPVWTFGEPEVAICEDLEKLGELVLVLLPLTLTLLDLFSLVLGLFIVSFMPSELVLTMYSEFFASPAILAPLFPSLLTGLLLDFELKSVGTSLCWALTLMFNLSTMADRDPLRFLKVLALPFESELGEGMDSWDPPSKLLMFKSRGLTFTDELDLDFKVPPEKTPRFLSLSRSLLLLFSPIPLLEGELATFFKVDMLGFPLPLAERCLGLVPWCLGLGNPWNPCLGLEGTWAGEFFGLELWCKVAQELEDLGFIRLGLSFPDNAIGRLDVGDGLNFRIKFGDVGVEVLHKGGLSESFILMETGLNSGSCLEGTFSGGPIGLSSRFFFRFFSFSSRLLLLLFLSFLSSYGFELEVIGVIVIEVGIKLEVACVIGIISMPVRFSRPPAA